MGVNSGLLLLKGKGAENCLLSNFWGEGIKWSKVTLSLVKLCIRYTSGKEVGLLMTCERLPHLNGNGRESIIDLFYGFNLGAWILLWGGYNFRGTERLVGVKIALQNFITHQVFIYFSRETREYLFLLSVPRCIVEELMLHTWLYICVLVFKGSFWVIDAGN